MIGMGRQSLGEKFNFCSPYEIHEVDSEADTLIDTDFLNFCSPYEIPKLKL